MPTVRYTRVHLPPISARAFLANGTWLKPSALEGRSFVYGLVTGLDASIHRLESMFSDKSAVESSNAFYKWARGEVAPGWKTVHYEGRRRLLLDVVEELLPSVRARVDHALWPTLGTDDSRAWRATKQLVRSPPAGAERLLSRLFGPDRLVSPTVGIGADDLAEAIDAIGSDVDRASLLAALIAWSRLSPLPLPIGPYFGRKRLAAQRDRLIADFLASAWVYPEDRALVEQTIMAALTEPIAPPRPH